MSGKVFICDCGHKSKSAGEHRTHQLKIHPDVRSNATVRLSGLRKRAKKKWPAYTSRMYPFAFIIGLLCLFLSSTTAEARRGHHRHHTRIHHHVSHHVRERLPMPRPRHADLVNCDSLHMSLVGMSDVFTGGTSTYEYTEARIPEMPPTTNQQTAAYRQISDTEYREIRLPDISKYAEQAKEGAGLAILFAGMVFLILGICYKLDCRLIKEVVLDKTVRRLT